MKYVTCLVLLSIFCAVDIIAKKSNIPAAEDHASESFFKRIFVKEKRTLSVDKKCKNLICLFDPEYQETIIDEGGALAFELMDALNEKIAPIIVTPNILENFCYGKIHRWKNIKKLLFQRSHFAGKLLTTNLSGWECYFHKNGGWVLLVPTRYADLYINEPISKENPEQCGFNLNNLEKVEDLSYATIVERVRNNGLRHNSTLDDFESLFLKKDSNDRFVPAWNIYVIGHGGPTPKVTIEKQDDRTVIRSIKKVQSDIEKIQSEVSQFELKDKEKELKTLLRKLKQIRSQGVTWDRETFYGTVGWRDQDFRQLLHFFEYGIKTSYLHYTTCFSGGFNQTLLSEELALIDVSFIVSTIGINEAVVYYSAKPMKFTNFFKKLDVLMCDPREGNLDQESRNALLKDSIIDIVGSLISKDWFDYKQPFVRLPSAGVFKAVDLAQHVELLTHSLAKAHEIEGSPIDYTDPSIKTIFIYPNHVKVPLMIKDHVAIVSPAPQTVHAIPKSTIHILEKVSYQDNLSSIIPNFVSFNSRYQPIVFVIKELYCLGNPDLFLSVQKNNPIVINDIIIIISFQQQELDVSFDADAAVDIDVVFTHNDNNYFISKNVPHLQKNIEELFATFKIGKFEILTEQQLALFAEKILDASFITALKNKNKPITLPLIIEYLEKQIHGAMVTKKVSAERYPVLLKKIKGLERITSPEALKMQKKFIVQTKAVPAVSWIHRLEVLENLVKKMLHQINTLMKKQQNHNLISFKERVEEIAKTIAKEQAIAKSQLTLKEQALLYKKQASDVLQRTAGQMRDVVREKLGYEKSDTSRSGYGRPR